MLCVEERYVVCMEQRHVVCVEERHVVCVEERHVVCLPACQPASLPPCQLTNPQRGRPPKVAAPLEDSKVVPHLDSETKKKLKNPRNGHLVEDLG